MGAIRFVDIEDNEIVEMIFDGNRLWLLLPQSYDPPELINLIRETAQVYFRSVFADCTDEGCLPASALGFDGSKVWATVNNRVWAINRSTGKGYLTHDIGWLTHGEMAFDGACMWMGAMIPFRASIRLRAAWGRRSPQAANR